METNHEKKMDPDLASLVLAPPKPVQPTIPATEGTKEKKADVDILQILKTQGKVDAEGKKPKKQAPEQPKKKRKRSANVELQPYNVSQAKRKPKAEPKKKKQKKEDDAPVTVAAAAAVPQPKTLLECMQQSVLPQQPPPPQPVPPPPSAGGTTVKEVITKIYFDLEKEIKRQNARKEKLEKRKEDPKIDQDELMDKLMMTDVLLRMHKEQQDVVIKYFPHCYMQF